MQWIHDSASNFDCGLTSKNMQAGSDNALTCTQEILIELLAKEMSLFPSVPYSHPKTFSKLAAYWGLFYIQKFSIILTEYSQLLIIWVTCYWHNVNHNSI
jgi:hypothetical protein